MNLPSDVDTMLTESWRFGNGICRVANLILHAKEKSDQNKNWIPYRTRPGIADNVARVTTKSLVGDWRTTKVTLIARADATLLLEALEVLGFDFGEDRGGGDNAQAEDAVPADERGNQGPAVSDDEDEFEPFPDDPAESRSHTVDSFPAHLPKIHINGQGESSGLRLWNKSLKLVE